MSIEKDAPTPEEAYAESPLAEAFFKEFRSRIKLEAVVSDAGGDGSVLINLHLWDDKAPPDKKAFGFAYVRLQLELPPGINGVKLKRG